MGSKTTKEIVKEYNISRQTLNNWINSGLISKPEKDFKNWYVWNAENENDLEKVIIEKTRNNNQIQKKRF